GMSGPGGDSPAAAASPDTGPQLSANRPLIPARAAGRASLESGGRSRSSGWLRGYRRTGAASRSEAFSRAMVLGHPAPLGHLAGEVGVDPVQPAVDLFPFLVAVRPRGGEHVRVRALGH